MCVSDNVNAAYNSEIVMFPVEAHPLPSVTVTEYVPATILLASCVVAPLLHTYV